MFKKTAFPPENNWHPDIDTYWEEGPGQQTQKN